MLLRTSSTTTTTTIIIIIIIIINQHALYWQKNSTPKDMIECVPNYTSTYARKQGYNWTKNTGMNMYQNQ